MFNIKYIWFFLLCFIVVGCQTYYIPDTYNYKVKEAKITPYGCWMEISMHSLYFSHQINKIEGELLAIQSDSSFLLSNDGFVRIVDNDSIISAKLYTHKNQSGVYLLTTFFFIIPNLLGLTTDYGADFLAIGIPVSIVGSLNSLSEGLFKRNILVYPNRNNLEEFNKFSRYPDGLPPNIDFRELFLKK